MTILVPARNISAMIKLTDAFVVKKQMKNVSFNHHAGNLFDVTIRVNFSKIEKFLKTSWVGHCENKDVFLSLWYNDREMSWSNSNLPSNNVALYAFGECYKYENYNMSNALYFNKSGKKISVQHRDYNENGAKRYINFKGEWFTNKKF